VNGGRQQAIGNSKREEEGRRKRADQLGGGELVEGRAEVEGRVRRVEKVGR
jgi:hypothetical protein